MYHSNTPHILISNWSSNMIQFSSIIHLIMLWKMTFGYICCKQFLNIALFTHRTMLHVIISHFELRHDKLSSLDMCIIAKNCKKVTFCHISKRITNKWTMKFCIHFGFGYWITEVFSIKHKLTYLSHKYTIDHNMSCEWWHDKSFIHFCILLFPSI